MPPPFVWELLFQFLGSVRVVVRVPAKGASRHVPGECQCVRCVGFQRGHRYADGHGRPAVHGASSRPHVIAKAERTLELVEELRSVVPVYDPADEFVIQALGVLLVRIERAEAALTSVEAEADARGEGPAATYRERTVWIDNLRKDLRSWLSVAERYFAQLGMSPGSRARLGLDIARAKHLSVVEWHERAALEEGDG